jgi:hypothetical protein
MQIRPLIVALWSVLTLTPGTLDAQPVRDAFRRANLGGPDPHHGPRGDAR